MNIYECIVASVCAIVIGLWGLVWLAGKTGLLEDEKKNAKKAYEDNLKKVKVGVRTQTEPKKRGRKPGSKSGKMD